MKTSLTSLFAALGLATVLTGCGDSSSSSSSSTGGGGTLPAAQETATKAVDSAVKATTEAAKTVGKETTEAAKAVSQEAAKATDATKEKLQEAANAVKAAVADAGPAAQETLNNLVAEVKKLIADGKGTEAAQKVQSALAGLKLSPEQQKIVDDLKKQIQDAVSKKGIESVTKAAGDLLKPKTQN